MCLYKSNPIEPERRDFIVLLVQPVDEERCVAHPCLAYLPHEIDEEALRWFQQLIFGQDEPILENQFPKRLPLDPRAEIPARSDASSLAYRRWLSAQGVTYGALPARRRLSGRGCRRSRGEGAEPAQGVDGSGGISASWPRTRMRFGGRRGR